MTPRGFIWLFRVSMAVALITSLFSPLWEGRLQAQNAFLLSWVLLKLYQREER